MKHSLVKVVKTFITAALVAVTFAGASVGFAAPASAEDTYYYNDVRNFIRSESNVYVFTSFADNPANNGSYYQGYGQAYTRWTAGITMSNTVAKDWWSNQAVTRALAIHEIGHAMSFRCRTQWSDPIFKGSDDAWATAYAWSRGYRGDGSGSTIYGNPTQAQVDVAARCS